MANSFKMTNFECKETTAGLQLGLCGKKQPQTIEEFLGLSCKQTIKSKSIMIKYVSKINSKNCTIIRTGGKQKKVALLSGSYATLQLYNHQSG